MFLHFLLYHVWYVTHRYRKDNTPVVSAVSPSSGTTAGNTLIEVRGQHFSSTPGDNTVYLMRNRPLSSQGSSGGEGGGGGGGWTLNDGTGGDGNGNVIKVQCTVTFESTTVIKCLTGKVSIIDGGYSMVVVHVKGKGFGTSSSVKFRYIDKWSSRTTWGGLAPPSACGDWRTDKTCKNSVWIPKGQHVLLDVDPGRQYVGDSLSNNSNNVQQ